MPTNHQSVPNGEEAAEQAMVLLVATMVLLALLVLVLTIRTDLRNELTTAQWQAIILRK